MSDDALVTDVLLFGGASSLMAAAAAGVQAWLHMREMGDICGAAEPHCAWCIAALAFASIGATLLGTAPIFRMRRRWAPRVTGRLQL